MAGDRGRATRERLVDVATHHLAVHGLDGLRASAVAEDAGVSEASVWHHLRSKSGLLVAVMERVYADLVDDARAVVDGANSPVDRLEAFVGFWLERIAADLALLGELQRHGRSSRDAAVVAAFADCNRQVTRLFERIVEDLAASGTVRPGLPSHVARDLFFGAAEHVLVGRALTGRDDDLDEVAATLLDVVLHGLVGADDHRPAPSLASIDAKLDRLLRETPGG